ncbi:hypothetical protein M569_08446 [Genlisea aurea]|uniref:Mon2/Sec7/BIG1-like dimerisation and cyclophilin-binding domain-containing protein n=1 Tax=Genlisea aurea TaxID=192259 RepID=S8CNL7_9LAMI|nr:hypothetical protein M569_08446 [Genlisea aurea]
MAGAAAGGFVARAFESMLKECANKKYGGLQSAIKTYLEALQVDLVLNPLRIAFETKNLKLVELALDCLHKLIGYNHLEGDPGLDSGTKSKLLADVLNMVCSCIGNSTPDSTTLQVLKVLLTSIASTKLRVHGDVLLAVISVCFNVALSSSINQATSKAMLAQMLTIIFRLESDVVPSDSLQPKEAQTEDRLNDSNESSHCCQSDPIKAAENLLHVKHVNINFPPYVEEIRNLDGATDVKGLEAIFKKAVSLQYSGKTASEMDPQFTNVKLCDALLVFRTLCEMSVKEGNDEFTIKSRILALELLQGSLDDILLSKSFSFIDSIRADLSYAILRASVSDSTILFQCAVEIFSVFLLRLRENVKVEIPIFFPLIVLHSLDGSDLNRKLTVLR